MEGNAYSQRLPVTKKLVYLICITMLFVLTGCSSNIIRVRGKIVSYDYVKLDDLSLNYLIINRNTDEDLKTGTARIKADGAFTIQVNRQQQLPCWVVISGVDSIPDVSVANNSHEITTDFEKQVDMGEVYIYDHILILGDFSPSVSLRDLRVKWESNIPDIDHYRVELLGLITVSGIRGSSFSFKTILPLLEKQGRFQIDGLEVIVNRDRNEGTFFLNVEAVRLINEKAVTVAGAAKRAVTIIEDR